MNSRVKRVAKAVIAVVVVIGLVIATDRAIRQWNQQWDEAQGRVAELQRQIETLESAAGPIDEAASDEQRRVLQSELAKVRAQVPSFSQLSWPHVAVAALLYWCGLIPGGLVLHEATRVLGYRVKLRDAVAAQIVGHLGKYVPGKAMVVVIRAGRLKGLGVPMINGSVAVFLETLLMMAVGAAIAGCLVFFLPVNQWIAWAALVGGIAATLPTLPPLLKWGVGKAGLAPAPGVQDRAGSGGQDPAVATKSNAILSAVSHDWRFFIMAWVWQLVAWALIGASFACLVESMPGRGSEFSTATVYAAAVASIALAMVVGFASLIPGGAGIRELTLAIVLAPVIGGSQALIAAILARLLFIVVELLSALAVTLLGREPATGERGEVRLGQE